MPHVLFGPEVRSLLQENDVEGMKAAVDRGDEDLSLPDRNTAIDEVAAGVARCARIGGAC